MPPEELHPQPPSRRGTEKPPPLTGDEEALYEAYRAAQQAYLRAARRAVLEHRPPPLTAAGLRPDFRLWPDPGLWQVLVDRHVRPVFARIFTRTLRGAPEAAEGLWQQLLHAVAGWPLRVWDRVQSRLAGAPDEDGQRQAVIDALADDEWEPLARQMAVTTATATSSGAAAEQARADGGMELIWRAVHDERTRPWHREADGQRQPAGLPFTVGGEFLMFPGDPTASPGNRVNCRCGLKAVRPRAVAAAAEEESMTATTTDPITAAATADTSLPWAPRDTVWDASAAQSRVLAWAKGDAARLAKSFVYKDPALDATKAIAYKLPVVDIIGGQPKLVWRAVANAAGRLGQLKGVSPEELGKIRSRLATLYSQARKHFKDEEIPAPDAVKAAADTDGGEDEGRPLSAEEIDKAIAALVTELDDGELDDDLEEDVAEYDNDQHAKATTAAATTVEASATDDAGTEPELKHDVAGCHDAAPRFDPAPAPVRLKIITASAATTTWPPPAGWFSSPQLDRPQAIRVDASGRITGHLAAWENDGQPNCHIGITGECVVPPHSRSGYRYFHQTALETSDGKEVEVGLITMDTGHAPHEAIGADAAVAHYDNTGTMAGVVRAGEDRYGIWVAGSILPSLTDDERLRLGLARFSGDWRERNGGLELIAALAVNTPGFPNPAVSREAVIAAGMILPDELSLTAATQAAPCGGHCTCQAREQGESDAQRWDDNGGAQPDEPAPGTAPEGEDLDEETASLVAAIITSPGFVDPTDAELRTVEEVLDDGSGEAVTAANWVSKSGGLPKYVKRISRHLREKGMTESHAIAVAINVVRRACSSGDLNFPGIQQVKATTRAKMCQAFAEWEALKARNKARKAA
ncbi:phage minor head protein [Streptoverticillium reticulum]|uniref:phage minor head protein n=1 Tax=Streptoverticillium reticulum TaxID=1433415 RepID=UPI0039BF41C8